MTRIIKRFEEIADDYDAVFCDVWGCVHNGIVPIGSAVSALRAFARRGGRVVLITNSPRTHDAVEAQIDRIGVPRSAWHLVVTSGDAAKTALFSGAVGRAVHHIGPDSALGFFDPPKQFADKREGISLVPLDRAEGIVCTGLFNDELETPEDYAGQLAEARRRGLKLLCANPDIVVDRGETRVFCAGAISQAYERLGGTTLLFGKPRRAIYDLARDLLAEKAAGIADSRILCIGDGIATDITGASGQGLDSLFVTGGLAACETGTSRQPDPEALSQFLSQFPAHPEYAIGQLR